MANPLVYENVDHNIHFVGRDCIGEYVMIYGFLSNRFIEGEIGGVDVVQEGVWSIKDDLIERLKLAYLMNRITADNLISQLNDVYLSQTFHWMGRGLISDEIKNQAGFGCCGEIAMSELLGAYLFIEEGGVQPLMEVSVQDLIDHTHLPQAGTYERLREYVLEHGVCSEAIYPFVGPKQDLPTHFTGVIEKVTCDKFVEVTPTFYDVIKHVRQCGPLLTAMYLTQRFVDFKRPLFLDGGLSVEHGVYSHEAGDTDFLEVADGSPRISHAVLVVGYDEATGSLMIKNSHGTNWANLGLGKISFTCFHPLFVYPKGTRRTKVTYDY